MGIYNQSNYQLLFNKLNLWDDSIKSKIDENASKVITNYEGHMKQVNALAKEYGFKAFFFWQPYLFSLTRNTTLYEQKIISRKSPVLVEAMQKSYLIAKKQFSNRERESIFFIGNILDNLKEPIYIDWCHLGPNGNENVAREMVNLIETRI